MSYRSELEVVINTRFGGFSLSSDAVFRMAALGHEGAKKAVENGDYPGYAICEYLDRHDPILIQVVKELGERADGPSARLSIEKVVMGYEINDYDGKESVVTY